MTKITVCFIQFQTYGIIKRFQLSMAKYYGRGRDTFQMKETYRKLHITPSRIFSVLLDPRISFDTYFQRYEAIGK